MKKNYISNSTESTRMFKSGVLENLSKVHFSVPLYIYVPVIIFCTYKAFDNGIGILPYLGYYIAGLAVWTITEYLLHRYIFHYYPSSKWGQRLHFIFHGVHHDYPSDSMRLVMVPSISIPLAALFYFLFYKLLGHVYVFPFFAGFLTGYLFYDMTHYAVHHFNLKSKFWMELKHHHMLHHYQDAHNGYGVSSKFWDLIFKTTFRKEKKTNVTHNSPEQVVQN